MHNQTPALSIDRVIRGAAWYMAYHIGAPIDPVHAFPLMVRDADHVRGGTYERVWIEQAHIQEYVAQYNAQELGPQNMLYDPIGENLWIGGTVEGKLDRLDINGTIVYGIELNWLHREVQV